MDLREESKKCFGKLLFSDDEVEDRVVSPTGERRGEEDLQSKSDDRSKSDIVIQLEKSIYNRALDQATKKKIHKNWKNHKFVTLYEDIFRHIMINLDPGSHVQNKALIERLKTDTDLAINIANMSMEELFPERWEKEYKEKEIRENILNNRKVNESSFLKCKRCKSKRVMVSMAALRSCDEGMIAMKVCQDCGFMSKS